MPRIVQLSIVRGDTNTLPLIAKDPLTNQILSLVNIASIKLTAKYSATQPDADAVFQISGPSAQIVIDNATTGLYTVTISPANMASLPPLPKTLFYDVQGVYQDGTKKTFQSGPLVITADATLA